jgi:hypothetical protein
MLALRLDAVRQFETAFDSLRRSVDLHPAAAERLERFDRAHQRVMSALTAALDDLREDERAVEQVHTPHTGTL